MKRQIINRFYKVISWVYGKKYGTHKSIVCLGMSGKSYSDSPRAVSEKMKELYPDYEIVWYLPKCDDKYGIIPEYVQIVKNKIDLVKSVSKSCCFITSEDIEDIYFKKKNQIFIQTWHGDRTLKKVLYDQLPKNEWECPIADEWLTDICVAGSSLGESVYRSAFNYYGPITTFGMPRNDKLLNPDILECKRIKDRMGIPDGKKVLLYAPTYRDNIKTKQIPTVDIKNVMNILNKPFDLWVCLLRTHISSAGIDNNYFWETCIDATDYPDMADLLSICDFLITDYSSCSGDFILCDKPMILAMFDRKEYEEECRELKFDPIEAGFIVAESQTDLEKKITNLKIEDYVESDRKLKQFFSVYETGEASKRLADIIDFFYNNGRYLNTNK